MELQDGHPIIPKGMGAAAETVGHVAESFMANVSRAIVNKEEGDDIKVVTPGGSKNFELVKLITIHDADA